jgi:hypothetical protein
LGAKSVKAGRYGERKQINSSFMPARTFAINEEIGKYAEYVVAYYLRSLGRMVSHHGGEGEQKFEGRALLTQQGKLISPDLSWFKWIGPRQRFFWGDVKAKTYCTLYNRSEEWQTGCDLLALDRYRLVSAETQKYCYMFFLQLRADSPDGVCPTGLFVADTAQLFSSHCAHVWRNNGMIYWDISVLSHDATLVDLFKIAQCAHYLQKIEKLL